MSTLRTHEERMRHWVSGLSPARWREEWRDWQGSESDVGWRAEMLRYAEDAHLAALCPADLIPLLSSADARIRTTALRVVGRIGRRDPS